MTVKHGGILYMHRDGDGGSTTVRLRILSAAVALSGAIAASIAGHAAVAVPCAWQKCVGAVIY